MTNSLLLGLGRYLIPVPALIWQRQITKAGREARARVTFMDDDHHQVRNFVVRELPRFGVPLSHVLDRESGRIYHPHYPGWNLCLSTLRI